MPIEIKELIIKAEVTNDVQHIQAKKSNANQVELVDKELIVEECVERILNILDKQKER